ncbi:hypothetical protein NE237_001066 [Protea cynaroides]|uniref:Uncharacterized protein n=1 Tax=Protea cynaroides TaxID=273540 RepID=A0A9Q0QY31_9MAGN|nr:hypothetical protein NE237_001066 [Protea cynaroides]
METLERIPSDDKLVWNADKFGRFLVKSVYHLISNCFDEKIRVKASSSRIDSWAEVPALPSTRVSHYIEQWGPLFNSNKNSARIVWSMASFIIWNLWKDRNEFYFHNTLTDPSMLIRKSKLAFREFASYTDAAFDAQSSIGSVGVIVRDSNANPILAFSQKFFCSSVVQC